MCLVVTAELLQGKMIQCQIEGDLEGAQGRKEPHFISDTEARRACPAKDRPGGSARGSGDKGDLLTRKMTRGGANREQKPSPLYF